MELRADLFRASAAQCHASAQKVETSEVRRAYLELMQGWRELADEIERLDRRRPKHLRELRKDQPPKDPHDDDEENEQDDEDNDEEDEEPAVIREPDEC
jgi:hypothetical protein